MMKDGVSSSCPWGVAPRDQWGDAAPSVKISLGMAHGRGSMPVGGPTTEPQEADCAVQPETSPSPLPSVVSICRWLWQTEPTAQTTHCLTGAVMLLRQTASETHTSVSLAWPLGFHFILLHHWAKCSLNGHQGTFL